MPDRYLGRQIGKYRVIRLLGSGAFAWVYEAIDRDLEIPVALKILRPEFAGQETAEARFRREAATAARLRHPNIVTVRDVGQTDGASFVAMDLLPLSLARRLELVTRLPEPEVVRLGLDVAAALAIAHAGGIIHRDIKPDNILIGTGGEGVVADFGLARALSSDASLSATNQVMGTPHYFSPEQARGIEIDGRSDLYSLGVTLYRAVVGRLPFEGDDWYAVARQHVENAPPPPRELVPDVTPAFEAILLRLLAKQPEDRFDTAIQLADALATLPTAPVQRGGALTPNSSSQTILDLTPVVPLPSAGKRRWGTGAKAAGVVAVLAAVLWGAEQQGGVVSRAFGRPQGTVAGPPAPGDSLGTGAVPPAVGGFNGLQGDSALRGVPPGDSAGPIDVPASIDAVGNPARPPVVPVLPPRAMLSISAPDSAALYVDGQRVGAGVWSGEHAAPASVAVRAVLTDPSQVDCPTAQASRNVRLSRGQPVDVYLPLRPCVGVRFDVIPREALVVFRPLDGGTYVEMRADSRQALVLGTGRYAVTATSPRCATYTDTVDVVRKADGSPWLFFARIAC